MQCKIFECKSKYLNAKDLNAMHIKLVGAAMSDLTETNYIWDETMPLGSIGLYKPKKTSFFRFCNDCFLAVTQIEEGDNNAFNNRA